MAERAIEPLSLALYCSPNTRAGQWRIGRADGVTVAMVFASLFAFFGVLGKLITPGQHLFRAYYFLLPVGLLAMALVGTRSTWKAVLTCVPMIAYLIFSAATAELVVKQSHTGPTARQYAAHASSATPSALMLINLSLFAIVAASHLKNAPTQSIIRLIEVFLSAYFLTLFAGYTFLIGGRLGLLSYPGFIHKFTYPGGLSDRRFQPGCDANEYGIMSSFALTTLLLYCFLGVAGSTPRTLFARIFSHRWTVAILAPLIFVALLLTFTRSAIIALACSMVWVLFRILAPRLRRIMITRTSVLYSSFTVVTAIAVVIPFAIFNTEQLKFLSKKFSDAAQGGGSTADTRLIMWREAVDNFFSSPLIGQGYHTHEYIHNSYLQCLADIGILGVSLLIATGAVLGLQFCRSAIIRVQNANDSGENMFLVYVTEVLLLSVFWFALTNHNVDQFLTWFAVLLVLSMGRRFRYRNVGLVNGIH